MVSDNKKNHSSRRHKAIAWGRKGRAMVRISTPRRADRASRWNAFDLKAEDNILVL